jgi:hypothetical protein
MLLAKICGILATKLLTTIGCLIGIAAHTHLVPSKPDLLVWYVLISGIIGGTFGVLAGQGVYLYEKGCASRKTEKARGR